MRREFAVAFAIAALPLVPLAAQEPPAPVGQSASTTGQRQTPLKVQLTVARFMGDKKISSVPYMLGVLTNAQKTSLRVGVQVPVTHAVFGPKSESGAASTPISSYTYRDIGTNIDCLAHDMGNGTFNLVITVEDSSIHLDKAGSSAADKNRPGRARLPFVPRQFCDGAARRPDDAVCVGNRSDQRRGDANRRRAVAGQVEAGCASGCLRLIGDCGLPTADRRVTSSDCLIAEGRVPTSTMPVGTQ